MAKQFFGGSGEIPGALATALAGVTATTGTGAVVLAEGAADSLLGNNTGTPGTVAELTTAQVVAMLATDLALEGLVPVELYNYQVPVGGEASHLFAIDGRQWRSLHFTYGNIGNGTVTLVFDGSIPQSVIWANDQASPPKISEANYTQGYVGQGWGYGSGWVDLEWDGTQWQMTALTRRGTLPLIWLVSQRVPEFQSTVNFTHDTGSGILAGSYLRWTGMRRL